MTTLKKTAALGASALMALGGVGATFATVATADAQQPDAPAATAEHAVSSETVMVKPVQVAGEFAFTQTEVASNEYLSRMIGEASKYLCNAQTMAANEGAAAEDWTFAVRGAVKTRSPCRWRSSAIRAMPRRSLWAVPAWATLSTGRPRPMPR